MRWAGSLTDEALILIQAELIAGSSKGRLRGPWNGHAAQEYSEKRTCFLKELSVKENP
jgi:hypothetical protein